MINTQRAIPSPVPYLLEVEDFRAHNTVYDWQTLFILVLMAIGCGRTSPLAVAQWLEDERQWLLAKGFGRREDAEAFSAQATIYRFFWGLEKSIEGLEAALQNWSKAVVTTSGQNSKLLLVNLDGKHLKGSTRSGRGDKAVVLIAAFLEDLGLTLLERNCAGDEAKQGRAVVMELGDALKGVRWCVTGDAAFTEKPLAERVLKKGVGTC